MQRVLFATFLCLLLSSALSAEDWPAWRGPKFNGVATGKGYPVAWGPDQNLAWKAELPGIGGSTPAVWGDSIIVTAGDQGQNAILCFDRQGNRKWLTHLGQERPGKHRKGSGANPSPTTDGERIFVYFKSGDLGCLDFQGRVLWRKNLQELYGEDTLWWDLGTSPVLTKSLLVVACIHSGPSYLVGINKQTGDIVWKHDRNLDAPEEANQTYSTPIPVEHNGRELLVVLGADHVTAHDAATGDEIWRVGGLNPKGNGYFRSIASPVVEGAIAVAPYARGTTLTAIRIDGSGDVTSSHVAWNNDELSSDVPTPAALDGRVYVCSDRGEVACLEAVSGKVIWRGEVEKRGSAAYSASPIIADGRLYVTREDGVISVLALGDAFKVLQVNRLGEFIVATPVFVDGQVLVRTESHLYCFGK